MAVFKIDIDPLLEKEVSDIYRTLGLDIETAIKIFLVRSKFVRGLPFRLDVPISRAQFAEAVNEIRAQAVDLPEMTLDEINAEISAVRRERKCR